MIKPLWKTIGLTVAFLAVGCVTGPQTEGLEPDLQADKINLTKGETFNQYLEDPGDPFDIDRVAIDKSILFAFVTYPGGCEEHKFALIGSDMIAESYPPQMFTTLVHDANGDACEAVIHDTLQFDLSPIAQAMGDDFDTLIIHVNKAPQDAVYDGSVITDNP